ncbi:amidase [Pueribacillus sp. YX66]|uniref:amidase n=1 Tax=Pueribacillus sp. YX66 TaxID=3229242 RepID=UPI00358D7DDF
MKALYYKTISQLAPKLEKQELSPVEVTRMMLERIEVVDEQLNSYITVMKEVALAQAKQAEREIAKGHYRGRLHGVPIALKDLLNTKGIRTTAGSQVLAEHIPNEDATVVTKLREAGAILLGKLNMHEFAFGVTNKNDYFGKTRNPWDVERTPGGSSGGSGAAVAAGLAFAALGSDTGGSIRTPSALNGIYGLKPTFGRVSKYGAIPLAWSLDHIGPMTRSVEDLAIVLQSIAGFDKNDPTTVNRIVPDYESSLNMNISGLRVGVPTNYFFDFIEDEVALSVKVAINQLEKLGATLVEVTIPELELSEYSELVTIQSEAAAYHYDTLQGKSHLYGNDVRTTLQAGQLVTAVQYVKAQQVRRLLQEALVRVFKEIDVIAAPTVSMVAPKWKESFKMIQGESKAVAAEFVRFAAPANLTGIPSLSVPTGFSSERLPIGMQLMGRPFEESTLLAIAAAFENEVHTKKQYPII